MIVASNVGEGNTMCKPTAIPKEKADGAAGVKIAAGTAACAALSKLLPAASAFTSHPSLLASHPHDTCETGHGRTLTPTARHWLPFIFPGHVSGADRLLIGRNSNASCRARYNFDIIHSTT